MIFCKKKNDNTILGYTGRGTYINTCHTDSDEVIDLINTIKIGEGEYYPRCI